MGTEYYAMCEKLSKEKRIVPNRHVQFNNDSILEVDKVDAACKGIIAAMQQEIPDEFHTVETMSYLLNATKDALLNLSFKL